MRCKICDDAIFMEENTIGKPLEYKICLICWGSMSESKRESFKKDGVVPITKSIINDEWRAYCKKYGFTP